MITKFHLLDATRLLLSLTQPHVPESVGMVVYFAARVATHEGVAEGD